MMGSIGPGELLIALVIPGIVTVICVLPFWWIFGKAGLAKGLSLLMLVPLVNIGLLYYLAFTDWPALKRGR
jgi:hypothetical protein